MSETEQKNAIARNILAGVKQRLGATWENRLDDRERLLIEECAVDAAALQVRALATPPGDEGAKEALRREMKHTDAQLKSIGVAAEGWLSRAFWDSFGTVAGQAVQFTLTALV